MVIQSVGTQEVRERWTFDVKINAKEFFDKPIG